MKHFLRSLSMLALLLSSLAFADHCNDSCDTNCNTNFNCNNNFNNCDTDCNRSCDKNSCSRDRDCDRDDKCCGSFGGRTGLHYRSQGANTARELVGWQWEINRPNFCNNYGSAYLAFEYTSTFRPRCLAEKVFGAQTWTFEGSLVANRARTSLVADNFGLSRNFQGSISFCPRIQNYIVDFGLYVGLDCWCPGLYFRLHAPFAHTRWCLDTRSNDCCDVCTTTTCPPFDPCYDSSSAATGATIVNNNPTSTTNSFTSAVNNAPSACTIEQALSGNFLWGDVKKPWQAGRFNFGQRCRNGLADVDLIFGYNFCNTPCAHFGAYIQAVLPTGTQRNNRFVFDPIIGNGRHFELGLGLSGHTVLWACENSNLAFFFEGNITHLFDSRQCRLFDFCRNGYLSRYLLLKEFDSNGTDLRYNGNLVSATNVNNRRVDVSLDVKGDASFKLAWRHCGWGFDLGYNIYGHSHEKIKLVCNKDCVENKKYGVKGTTGVCCFNFPVALSEPTPVTPPVLPSTPLLIPANTPTALISANRTGCTTPLTGDLTIVTALPDNCTQPNATAFTVIKQNNPTYDNLAISLNTAGAPCSICLASNSDAPRPFPDFPLGTPLSQLTVGNGFVVSSDSINGCNTKLIDPADSGLNLKSAEAPGLLTHKVFAHLDYVWQDCCGYNPHLGIGGEAEFEQRRWGNDCSRGSFNQWGVWIKGSLNF